MVIMHDIAKYKGQEFYLAANTFDGGRRLVVQSFPGSDKHSTEDMGRLPRRFSIPGYFVGEDCYDKLTSIIAIAEDGRPGEFYHPIYGALWVRCESFSVADTPKEGNTCGFNLSIIEDSGEVEFKQRQFLSFSDVRRERMQSNTVSQKRFGSNSPAIITQTMNKIAAAQNEVNSLTERFNSYRSTINAVGEFKSKVDTLRGSAIGLIYTPAILASDISSILNYGTFKDSLESVKISSRSALNHFREITAFADTLDLSLFDPTVFAQMIRLFYFRTAIFAAAACCCDIPYQSRTEAEVVRDYLLRNLDLLIEIDNDAQTINHAYSMKIAVAGSLQQLIISLPYLSEYNPTGSLPAAIIAYQVYGKTLKEQDIVARNKIVHPGFVTDAVEVLV